MDGSRGIEAIDLVVNGERVSVRVDPATPLLWVLREDLRLTGTKFGCGAAQCGACTVHVDGRARALVRDAGRGRRPASASRRSRGSAARRRGAAAGLDRAGRAAVRLLPDRADHERGGAARRERARRPTPTSTPAWRGNVCRCGTYVRIRSAIHRAAELARGGRVMEPRASPAPARLPARRRPAARRRAARSRFRLARQPVRRRGRSARAGPRSRRAPDFAPNAFVRIAPRRRASR